MLRNTLLRTLGIMPFCFGFFNYVLYINKMIHMFPNWSTPNIYARKKGAFRTAANAALIWTDIFVCMYENDFTRGSASLPAFSSPQITLYCSFGAFLLVTMKTTCLGPFYSFGLWCFIGGGKR